MTRNYKPLTIYQTRFTLFLNTALHENKQPNAHLFLNHGALYLKGFKEYIEVEVQVSDVAVCWLWLFKGSLECKKNPSCIFFVMYKILYISFGNFVLGTCDVGM